MKHIFSRIISAASIAAVAAFMSGCVEEIPAVNEDLVLGRCLTPTGSSVTVSQADGQTVTFTWVTSKGPSNYYIEIFEGGEESDPETVFEGTPVKVLEPETSPASVVLESDKFYFARIKAQNPESGIDDSKWLTFPYPIGTYEVKPSVEPVLVDRTESTISLKWTQIDEFIVDQVRVSPNPDASDGKAYKSYPVNPAGQGDEVTFTVDGLQPSVKYTVAVHYRSANRGELYVWTRPSLTNPTVVATTEAFANALRDGAPVIKVTNTETPYVIYDGVDDNNRMKGFPVALPAEGSMRIYGDGDIDGKKPTVIGTLKIPAMAEFHVEGLEFVGNEGSMTANHTFSLASGATEMTSFSVLNCDMTGYNSGFFYVSGANTNVGTLSFSNIMVTETAGTDGDAFDIRDEISIGSITIRESTFSNGIRSFIRIDKAAVSSFQFENNTLNSLCSVESNNKGLFYIRGSVSVFNIKKNLFLNMNGHAEKTVLFSDAAAADAAKFSSNYYYRLGNGFWMPEKSGSEDLNPDGKGKVTQTQGTADGGVILSGDPCENSEEGILYVKRTSDVYSKAVGDPRWLENYVPVVEDLTLTGVDYGKSWTLNDTKLYGDVVKKDIVRDNLRFFSQTVPFNILSEGLEFTGAGITGATGVPTDGAIAFKVNGPGSVILSVAKSRTGDNNNHLSVALGDADGKSASVKGAAYVGGTKVKVAFPTVEPGQEQIVYLYACGPLVLTAMQWSEDTDTGAAAILETPVPSIDQPSVDDTFTGTVTVSWQQVASAGSYKVTVNGEEHTVTETAYLMTPSEMSPGKYTITVQALVAEGDISKENSEVSAVVEFEILETLKQVSSALPTVWDPSYFAPLITTYGTGDLTEDFIAGNLKYITGGGKFKFGENEVEYNGVNGKYARVQIGGTGTPGEKASMQFIAGGPGTLTVTAVTGGDETSVPRVLAVAVGGEKVGSMDLPLLRSDGLVSQDFVCSSAVAGSAINIYSENKGINVFEIIWTPEGYDPEAGIPSDPEAIEQYEAFDITDASLPSEITSAVTSGKFTLVGSAGKKLNVDVGSARLKFNGASSVDDATGLPTDRFVSFKVTGPGLIKHYVRDAGSSGNEDYGKRVYHIVLAKELSDGSVQLVDLNADDNFAPTSGYKAGSEKQTRIDSGDLSGTTKTAAVYIYVEAGCNLYYLDYTPDA